MRDENTQKDNDLAKMYIVQYFSKTQEDIDVSNVFVGLEDVVSEINEMFK